MNMGEINHPEYYNNGGIEAIDCLKKARWYLEREIQNLGGNVNA